MAPQNNLAESLSIKPYVLGLDLGTDSIGWAVLDWNGEQPTAIRRLGVRRFEAGVLGNIEAGRDEAPGTARRTARQQRRQLWRRARRMRNVFRILSAAGLLPASGDSADERFQTINILDQNLAQHHLPPASNANRATWHLLPYQLRAAAVEGRLQPFALGRALYHLTARRGYQSNLKAKKDEKEEGVVKAGIGELEQLLAGRTLGQYFATVDPEEKRIRQRYTSRKMYLDEFEKIWCMQAKLEPERFNDELKKKIHQAIFWQRPLKSQRGLVGMCEREPSQRRAPLASLVAQRFRMLQKVNDLTIENDSGSRELLDGERAKVIETLEREGELKWTTLRKLLGLKGPRGEFRGDKFNFEEGGDKALIGNRSTAKMFQALGETWTSLSEVQQAALVDEVLNFTSEEALARRLQKAWNLSAEQAEQVAAISFEPGYASLSRRAMGKLLPKLEQGERLQTVMKEVYGATVAIPMLDLLPPVHPSRNPREKDSHPAFTQLRNPTVARALTELRKVVNAIIREYGKPAQIRLELARDLKKSRKDRQEIQSFIKANEKTRDDAKEQILAECGEKFCTPHNILKLRLAEECKWLCPYTGKPISMDTLIGDHPQFDVEHIYPFSWSLDNSYANKTLCHVDYNRLTKKNQTPFVAAGHTVEWQEIVNRVRRFTGSAAREKLRRFLNEEVTPDFCQRQLSETRYISRLAAQFLELLYGGRSDADHQQRVYVRSGQATAYLRAELKFNTLLGDPDDNEKSRADHRHHAIDAVVVALTDQGTIKQLAEAAERANVIGRRLLVPIEPPWPTILDDLRQQLAAVHISSRVNRKLAGQLHDATVFSKPHPFVDGKGKPVQVHHVRKPLAAMSRQEIERIVDNRVRELVQKKLELIGLEPAKVFQDDQNLPYLTAHDGRIIPIRRARIRKADSTIQIGRGTAARFVAPGANHHMEIVAVLSADGSVKKWDGIIVSRFEAHQRKAGGQPVVQRDHGPNKKFLFSLAGGEHVLMQTDGTKEEDLYRVTVISDGQLEFVHHLDARPITERKKIPGARVRCSPSALAKQNAKKVVVDPLGNILPAND